MANLADTIKMAVDYISMSNLNRTHALVSEFRMQRLASAWGDNVLQFYTTLWYAWVSLSSLCKSSPPSERSEPNRRQHTPQTIRSLPTWVIQSSLMPSSLLCWLMTLFLRPLQPVITNLMMRFQESWPRWVNKWSNRGREIKFGNKENTRPPSWRHTLQSLVVTLPVRVPTASADSTDLGYWITCKFCLCLLPVNILKSVV